MLNNFSSHCVRVILTVTSQLLVWKKLECVTVFSPNLLKSDEFAKREEIRAINNNNKKNTTFPNALGDKVSLGKRTAAPFRSAATVGNS